VRNTAPCSTRRCCWRSARKSASRSITLAASESFHGIEWYLPYFYSPGVSLLEHLPAEAALIVDDALDLFATLRELDLQVEGLRAELEHTGELPRRFERSSFTADELKTKLLERRPALLGYGDLFGKTTSANTPLARSFAPGPRFGGKVKEIAADLLKLHNAGHAVALATRQAARMRDVLQEVHLARPRPERSQDRTRACQHHACARHPGRRLCGERN
jgi:hypothetical protein